MDGETARRILRGRAVKRVEAARVGEEPEHRLRRARVAEELGERGRFESEGREEGCARDGVERAVVLLQAKVSSAVVELRVAQESIGALNVAKELGWFAQFLRELRQELRQVDHLLADVRETEILCLRQRGGDARVQLGRPGNAWPDARTNMYSTVKREVKGAIYMGSLARYGLKQDRGTRAGRGDSAIRAAMHLDSQ